MTSARRYRVFLCYNQRDAAAVEAINARLRTNGLDLDTFFEKHDFIAGNPWQETIEQALAQSQACAVFYSGDGFDPWPNETMRLAIDQRAADNSFRVIPVLLPGRVQPSQADLPGFLRGLIPVVFAEGIGDEQAIRRLVAGIKGRAPGSVVSGQQSGKQPYIGLQAFTAEDEGIFFGRTRLIEEQVARVGKLSFLIILGASGSGKSSLVRAGLIPALKAGGLPGSRAWSFLPPITPGDKPFDQFTRALSHLKPGDFDFVRGLRQHLPTDPSALLDAVSWLGFRGRDRRIVVTIDQFEELWTQLPPAGAERDALIVQEQQPFLRALKHAAAPESPFLFLLTMRADFLGRAAEDRDLANLIGKHNLILSPMQPDELREAIVGPASKFRFSFEAGLVDKLIEQVGKQAGALPLLQDALLQLWEARSPEGVMTHQALAALDGVAGALALRAERLLEEHYADPEQRRRLRAILLRLVQFGEGTEDIRRRSPLRDLVAAGASLAATEQLLKPLVDTRLLTMSDEQADRSDTAALSLDVQRASATVEITHEALLSHWPRLREWIEESRSAAPVRTQLETAARTWERQSRDPKYLYNGVHLDNARKWADDHPQEMNSLEEEFYYASLRAQRHAERRRTWSRGGLALLVLAFVIVGFEAARQSVLNLMDEQRSRAALQRGINAECSLALAIDAYRTARMLPGLATVAVEDELRSALIATRVVATLPVGAAAVNDVSLSPDGQLLATADDEGVKIWDAERRTLLWPLDETAARYAANVDWAADGHRLATVYKSGTVELLSVVVPAAGEAVVTIEQTLSVSGDISVGRWSPDNRFFAFGKRSSGISIVDMDTGEQRNLYDTPGSIIDLSWSADNTQLAVVLQAEGMVKLIDARRGSVLRALGANINYQSVAWAPQGRLLAAARSSGEVDIFDTSSGGQQTLMGANTNQLAIAWNSDGTMLATGDANAMVRVWDLSQSQPRLLTGLTGHTGIISAVHWHPSRNQFFTSSWDKTVRLWRLSDRISMAAPQHVAEYTLDAAWSPSGEQIAFAVENMEEESPDSNEVPDSKEAPDGIELWEPGPNRRATLPVKREKSIQRIAWGLDGASIAFVDWTGSIIVSDAASGQTLYHFPPVGSRPLRSIAWHPDGKRLVVVAEGGLTEIVNVQTGERIEVTYQGYYDARWSPDGSRLAITVIPDRVLIMDDDGAEQLQAFATESLPASLDWSPDGSRLAAGTNDGSIYIWDVATGRLITSFRAHAGIIWSVDWHPDGTLLASAGNDGKILLWDGATGQLAANLIAHTSPARTVAWSPDGSQLLSAGTQDQTVRLQPVAFDQILAQAEQQVAQGLTPAELARCRQ